MKVLEDKSIDLVVTSPPYPMIEMWDNIFSQQDPNIKSLLNEAKPYLAFEKMHQILDKTWCEIYRVLKDGGIACINIGDALRTINNDFCLYSNHSRILNSLSKLGFMLLPDILWRKETNAPNKFMGSGMLPVGAYVTYEHEYILIARKSKRRQFTTEEEKAKRKESAFFWEERNLWFSDIWYDIKGTTQKGKVNETRFRNGAFPFELAYRLILMFSIKGDWVLDPFLGTGTTLEAVAVTERNGVGIEVDKRYYDTIKDKIMLSSKKAKQINKKRLEAHIKFTKERQAMGKLLKHNNHVHDLPVMTSQETEIRINNINQINQISKFEFEVIYSN